MTYYVAKSYQEWERVNEPYEANGKMYVVVRKPTGATKIVRAYTENEYRKMYPKETCGSPVLPNGIGEPAQSEYVVKNILGFQEGYIWIFKGDLENAEYWFEKTPEARYSVKFGWYIVSTESIPFDIPSCISSVKLPWALIGNEDGTLKPDHIIKTVIDKLIYDEPASSQFVGKVGDRIEINIEVIQAIPLEQDHYGNKKTLHIFQDEESNEFVWITQAKILTVGSKLRIRGTIKEHKVYRNKNQTILTRCTIL